MPMPRTRFEAWMIEYMKSTDKNRHVQVFHGLRSFEIRQTPKRSAMQDAWIKPVLANVLYRSWLLVFFDHIVPDQMSGLSLDTKYVLTYRISPSVSSMSFNTRSVLYYQICPSMSNMCHKICHISLFQLCRFILAWPNFGLIPVMRMVWLRFSVSVYHELLA